MEPLERAIQIAGGQAALAAKIGKTQAHVAMWLRRRKVPAEVCADIELATGAAVTCAELRPDVFRRPPAERRKHEPKRSGKAA